MHLLMFSICLFFCSCNLFLPVAEQVVPESSLELPAESKFETKSDDNTNDAICSSLVIVTEYYNGEFITGCSESVDQDLIDIKFSVELDKTTYSLGETVTLYTLAENLGPSFMYTIDYGAPTAWLQPSIISETQPEEDIYRLYREPFIIPEDIPPPQLCNTGDTWGQCISIKIPENALTGIFDIMVYSHGYTTVAKNIVEIIP